MNLQRNLSQLFIAIASCSFLLLSSFTFTEENRGHSLQDKGKFIKRDSHHGPRGHHGHRGHRGHHGYRGQGGRQGHQGIQGLPGLRGDQGEEGTAGPVGNMVMSTAWGFNTGSQDSFELYACTLSSTDVDKQFLQPLPLFHGYVPAGAPITFSAFEPGYYPIATADMHEGKFTIQTGGAGQYIIQYGLVGVPNGTPHPYASLLLGDFCQANQFGNPPDPEASCWICVKITHSNGTIELLGARPLSLTWTLNAQRIPDPNPQMTPPHNYSSYVLAGFGQISRQLTPGDEVTLVIMLGSLNQLATNVPLQIPSGQITDFDPDNTENRILYINANNTIYRWSSPNGPAGSIDLSRGPTLSLIRIGA
jgi:hypothetical protein